MEKAVVVTDIKDKSNKGSVTVPNPTQAEIETLVGAYKAQLYERFYPVTQSVKVYMQRKAEAVYLAALNEVKAFFNQTITFNIVENIPDGEKSQYDGYALRFAPLSENAVKESWSGTMKGMGGAALGLPLVFWLVKRLRLQQGASFLLYTAWFSAVRLAVLPLRALTYPDIIKTVVYPLLYVIVILLGIAIVLRRARTKKQP